MRLRLTKTCVIGQILPMATLTLLQHNAQMVFSVVKTEATLVELIDERINNICVHEEYNDTDEKRDTLMNKNYY